jgi:hypothetical protein
MAPVDLSGEQFKRLSHGHGEAGANPLNQVGSEAASPPRADRRGDNRRSHCFRRVFIALVRYCE